MRDYLKSHPERRGSFSPSQLKELDELVRQAAARLEITDRGEKNEIAARILTLYILGGRTAEQILDTVVHMELTRVTPGGRLNASHPNSPRRVKNGLASDN